MRRGPRADLVNHRVEHVGWIGEGEPEVGDGSGESAASPRGSGLAEIAVRDAEERGDLRRGGVERVGRHGGGAEHGTVAETARVEHGAEAAHEPFSAALGNEVEEVRLGAVQLARERLERAGAERDAALQLGQPAPFRGGRVAPRRGQRRRRHFFSGSSARLYG